MGPARNGIAGHTTPELTAVFAGGLLGALLRGALLELLPHEAGTWPWATFTANMIGTALLAWLVLHIHREHPVNAKRRRMTEAGLCGALTTFSAFQLELLGMIDAGEALLALGYGLGSVGAGFALASIGVIATRRLQEVPAEEPAG